MTEVGSVQAKREACEGFHNPGPQRPGPSVPGGQLPSRDICKCLRGPQLVRAGWRAGPHGPEQRTLFRAMWPGTAAHAHCPGRTAVLPGQLGRASAARDD